MNDLIQGMITLFVITGAFLLVFIGGIAMLAVGWCAKSRGKMLTGAIACAVSVAGFLLLFIGGGR